MAANLDRLLVIDLEGTCDEPKPKFDHEIIEIGLAIVNPKAGTIVSKEQTFVVPTTSWVTPFCTKLTTIKPEDVTRTNGARSFKEACAWLEKHGSKNRVWASWGDYDRTMFERQCKREGVAYPFGPSHINIKTLFALFEGLDRGIGTKEAVEYMKLQWYGTHHRGIDDAINIANILLELVKKYNLQTSSLP